MISLRLLIPVLGSAFILGGLIQFLPNPGLDPVDMPLDPTRNLLHILAGIVLWIGGHLGYRRNTIFGTGLAFLAFAIVGSFASGDLAPGVARIGGTDHWFNVMLAFVLIVVALATSPSETECQPCDPVLRLPPSDSRGSRPITETISPLKPDLNQ
ncbi:MAG: hypothetical protein R3229_11995 [Alphaproteobacteria bacterium]|nr:hypothetical protein [Alphaproteobacteria bacterium]